MRQGTFDVESRRLLAVDVKNERRPVVSRERVDVFSGFDRRSQNAVLTVDASPKREFAFFSVDVKTDSAPFGVRENDAVVRRKFVEFEADAERRVRQFGVIAAVELAFERVVGTVERRDLRAAKRFVGGDLRSAERLDRFLRFERVRRSVDDFPSANETASIFASGFGAFLSTVSNGSTGVENSISSDLSLERRNGFCAKIRARYDEASAKSIKSIFSVSGTFEKKKYDQKHCVPKGWKSPSLPRFSISTRYE